MQSENLEIWNKITAQNYKKLYNKSWDKQTKPRLTEFQKVDKFTTPSAI